MTRQRGHDLVVLITGGSSGIGRAAALAFAREGAAVGLLGRNAARLDETKRLINSGGGSAVALPGDITSEASVRQAVAACIKQYGRIDTLVNSAGSAAPAKLLHETSDEDWEELLTINLTGMFRVVRSVLPHMMAQRSGTIVNVASIAGLVGMPCMAAYGVVKSGVVALTKSIAVEYGGMGIRCNCVCPGTVETPMTAAVLTNARVRAACEALNPLHRIASPEEIAETVLHLGCTESSFMNGAVLMIDGGYTAV